MTTIVKFIKNFSPYLKGEKAGFDDSYAKELMDIGVAKQFKKIKGSTRDKMVRTNDEVIKEGD